MVRSLLISVSLVVFVFTASAQTETPAEPTAAGYTVFSAGLLHGGGALIGADIEHFFSDRVAVQVGGGLVGFGGGVNFHLEPEVYSPAVSLQFWNQGISGDNLSQRVAGVSYLYRGGSSGLTGQIGLGYVLETGKVMKDYYKKNNVANPPKVILLYSFGWCF